MQALYTQLNDVLLLPTNPQQNDTSAASETNRFQRSALQLQYDNLLRPFAGY